MKKTFTVLVSHGVYPSEMGIRLLMVSDHRGFWQSVRATTPCCGADFDNYVCTLCSKDHRSWGSKQIWNLNTWVDIGRSSLDEWVAGILGLDAEEVKVTW